MTLSNLISPKVVFAALGAGGGATISATIIWIIGAWGYGVGFAAVDSNDAVDAVPLQLVALIGLVGTVLSAGFSGYMATDPARGGGSNADQSIAPTTVHVINNQPDPSPTNKTEAYEAPDVSDENVSTTDDSAESNTVFLPGDSRPIYLSGN